MIKSRRNALKMTCCFPVAAVATPSIFAGPRASESNKSSISQDAVQRNVFGDRPGLTPHLGLVVSMMDWMRGTIMYEVRGMSKKDLDYLHDDNSNSVGAMLMHLAATERFYQINTFDNRAWGDWEQEDDEKWSVAMGLGQAARDKFKGENLAFYEDALSEVRENSKKMMGDKDDSWINYTDESFVWGPTNNWCKWFHVVEHESNHNGQIKWLKGRM